MAVDQQIPRSRRLCELSPTSVEPSPRRNRSNKVISFEPVQASAKKTNPSPKVPILEGEPSLAHNYGGNSLALARVLF